MRIPENPRWDVVYESSVRTDGTLYFPERLTIDFLEEARRTMGTYLFANQYLNEIVPDGKQPLKKEWIKYYTQLPAQKNTFAFIDPAISDAEGADYTAVVVVDVDCDQIWYLKHASRQRLNPTQIVSKMFDIQAQFKCSGIGVEDVAYQKALLYMLDEEMKRRQMILPVKGLNGGNLKTKEQRIRGVLVPRFEWGRILLAQGLYDFELEYSQFPRSSHDDMLDALSQLDQLIWYPRKEDKSNERPAPGSADYEKWFISQLAKGERPGREPTQLD